MFFFFNDTATTEIYTLSLHDALPISRQVVAHETREDRCRLRRPNAPPRHAPGVDGRCLRLAARRLDRRHSQRTTRSEEHTSELQSQSNLVCRLLLEKKKYQRNRLTSQ